MEQLTDIILTFDAFAKSGDGNVAPFSLIVRSPKYIENRGYGCHIECPYLREKPYLIFGVDEEQACELSIDFIRRSLVGRATVVDKDGISVKLPEIA